MQARTAGGSGGGAVRAIINQKVDLPIQSPLHRLLELARKREFVNLALDKGALAVAIVTGGIIVLLLAGTDILNWYWLALVLAASLGAAGYLLRKSLSSRYLLAQRIDRKLELKDALSTACYFAENPQPEKAALCESQFREAETVAAQVDVKQALPLTRSRYLAPAVALAAIAFGLFAVRYLVSGSLDLKASLVQTVYDNFFSNKTAEARNQLPPRAKFDPQTGNPNQPTPQLEEDRQPEDLLDAQEPTDNGTPGDDNSKTASENGEKKQGEGKQGEGKAGDKKDDSSSKENDSKDQNAKESSDAKESSSSQEGKQGGKPSAGNQKNESMLNKMKDAISSLMDKMKPQSQEGSKGDQSPPQSNASDQKQDQNDKSDQAKDKQSQAAANGDQSQQADGKQSSDSSNDQKASQKSAGQDSKTGIGAQDGDKSIKQAEQLAAMGKISQIIGKRSAAVSGEVMVEVGSSKQQLKTQWAPNQANHTNAGGEIHRDEIPLIDQQFIQKYFEEVHKSVPPPADPAAKKSGDG